MQTTSTASSPQLDHTIPNYPAFKLIDFSMQPALHPRLALLKEGVSEFTFAALYLFRTKYEFTLSVLPGEKLGISATYRGVPFLMFPCGLPDLEIVHELFRSHEYIKCLPEPFADAARIPLEQNGYCVIEDRDNFDYLYRRKDLSELPGRKMHKKRNLVNAFINNYTYEEKKITSDNKKDAVYVLEKWMENREDPGDYEQALEGLEKMEELNLSGCLTYVDETPAAYSLGEPLAKGRFFAVHFEKGIGDYKGIYQFINRSFASMLNKHYVYINREQDMGDPGLRQAKMSYRPSGFVKKYKVISTETGDCAEYNDLG